MEELPRVSRARFTYYNIRPLDGASYLPSRISRFDDVISRRLTSLRHVRIVDSTYTPKEYNSIIVQHFRFLLFTIKSYYRHNVELVFLYSRNATSVFVTYDPGIYYYYYYYYFFLLLNVFDDAPEVDVRRSNRGSGNSHVIDN